MKKNLLLYILLAFLVVMNGFFLFKHFGNTDLKDAPRKGPARFISKQLKFDDAQTAAYDKLDIAHRKQMKVILDDIKVAKDDLFDKLFDETIDKLALDSLAAAIATKEAAKDAETFYFFKSIRDLCNEGQKERFESIIKDALRGPGPPGGEGPPGRDGPPGGPGGDRRPPPRQ